MIFKLQMELPTGNDCLCYNKDKSIFITFNFSVVRHLFEPGEYRVYIAGLYEDKKLKIIRKVNDQPW